MREWTCGGPQPSELPSSCVYRRPAIIGCRTIAVRRHSLTGSTGRAFRSQQGPIQAALHNPVLSSRNLFRAKADSASHCFCRHRIGEQLECFGAVTLQSEDLQYPLDGLLRGQAPSRPPPPCQAFGLRAFRRRRDPSRQCLSISIACHGLTMMRKCSPLFIDREPWSRQQRFRLARRLDGRHVKASYQNW